jgi:hypothetical protein
MELVFKSQDIIEVHIVSEMLKANGIDTFVGGHYLQGTVGILTGLNYANIQVPNSDSERSKELIRDYDAKGQVSIDKVVKKRSSAVSLLIKVIVFIGFLALSIFVAI